MSRTSLVNEPCDRFRGSGPRASELAAHHEVEMPELELHQLDRTYEKLRIATPAAARQMLSSLATEGQRTPILVIERAQGRYLLIDGYQRLWALEKLGRDTASALVLDLDETSALIYRHRQGRSSRSSALEDAWLLQALVEEHGLDQLELARRMGHNHSWVSRHLALLTALSRSVQQMVRKGELSPYLAMKYLVPLARAKASDAQKLAEKLAGHKVSTRQMERLYVAWRSSDDEGRARLVDDPMLFLQAAQEMEHHEPPHPDSALIKDIEMLGAIGRRATRRLSRRPRDLALPSKLRELWPATHQSLNTLRGEMEQRSDDRQ